MEARTGDGEREEGKEERRSDRKNSGLNGIRCRRGHGLQSCSGQNIFQALISQLLIYGWVYNCDDQRCTNKINVHNLIQTL